MTMSREAAELLAREGIAALRAGDGARARDRFETLIAEAPEAPPPWFPLAQACRLTGDAAGEIAALERHLAAETRHLPALLMMGDAQARSGDDRAAVSWYRAAINTARQQTVPPQLRAMLDKAESFLADASARFDEHLHQSLADAGLADGRAGARLRQSLDLLLGKTQLYLQQPSLFYFPGMPQRQFYERDEFPWLAEIEAAAPDIIAELGGVLAGGGEEFAPYVSARPGRPQPANALLDDPSWGAYYLWQDGALVADHAAACPRTVAALEAAPIPVIAERSPMALFSKLTPGTHIAPHHGMLNTRLIVHLPLIVPSGCALRVGSETREWRVGEALVFDDSFEHEAWNRGDSTRVVLLFEVWRPEIHDEERAALTRIFEAINVYQGKPVDPD